MKYLVLIVFLLSTNVSPSVAQKSPPDVSAGRKKVEDAYKFQNKLADSSVTVADVIQKWSRTERDPDVRKDPDAQAIAFGCEGLLELQRGQKLRADSLLSQAMPRFRWKHSKESFLVTYAELERQLKHYDRAVRSYQEIAATMDSIPELWDITYYRQSGYAPYAYAIDACYGLEQIASADADYHKKAVESLSATMDRHPVDALGLMALVALHRLHAISDEQYKFKLDLLCSRRPELRKVSDLFEKRLVAK
ncbi:MAG TPA: hypothetical protein VG537_05115 [Candidatus Kapabacteria bacterium]|jgi:hypothetical protein|nr:hypothetical protein [Candidatus Kapabacteria bacterium]